MGTMDASSTMIRLPGCTSTGVSGWPVSLRPSQRVRLWAWRVTPWRAASSRITLRALLEVVSATTGPIPAAVQARAISVAV